MTSPRAQPASSGVTLAPAQAGSWAVVGGGMMGMLIALRLAQAGADVSLIEAANELGGLAAPWELETKAGASVTWDRHYHVTLLSDSFTRGVLRELGLEAEMQWVETGTGYLSAGSLSPMSNALEYLSLPGLSMLDKARVAATIVYASRVTDFRRLEELTVEQWLTRLSGASAFRKLWRPLLEAKLGDSWKTSSAAFIWATIQRLYAARRTGLKKEMFGYVPGGYSTVVQAFRRLLESEGVRVRLGAKVERIERGSGRLLVQGDGTQSFDRVVLTTTPKTVARLCPDIASLQRQQLRGVDYQGIVCPSLLCKKSLSDYYLTYITDPDVPFTAVVEMTAFVDPKELDGHRLIYLPRYAKAGHPVFALGDEELKEHFLNTLARLYPGFDPSDVVGFRVSRVKEVFPLPTLGFSKSPLPTTFSELPGLSAISSAHIQNGTLNVNDTLRVAERASRSLVFSGGTKIYLD